MSIWSCSLSGYEVNLIVAHGHLAPEDRIEDSDERHEKFRIHATVSLSHAPDVDTKNLENFWNYAWLVSFLDQKNGTVLTDPIESFAQDILTCITDQIKNSPLLKFKPSVEILIDRIQLIDPGHISIRLFSGKFQ